jgi:hypothetical protein
VRRPVHRRRFGSESVLKPGVAGFRGRAQNALFRAF